MIIIRNNCPRSEIKIYYRQLSIDQLPPVVIDKSKYFHLRLAIWAKCNRGLIKPISDLESLSILLIDLSLVLIDGIH